MSDYFPGHRYHHQQPSLGHWTDQNRMLDVPFYFSSYFHYSHDHIMTFNGGLVDNHLHLHHHDQPNTAIFEVSSTTNSSDGPKAYFRFHGGIGGGCCGEACRNIQQITAARPLELFNALDQTDFQMLMLRPPVQQAEGNSNGTGFFMPSYQNRNRAGEGMHVRGGQDGSWRRRHVETKQEDVASSSRAFAGGDDVVEEKEPQDIEEEIPIELLLPLEWTY